MRKERELMSQKVLVILPLGGDGGGGVAMISSEWYGYAVFVRAGVLLIDCCKPGLMSLWWLLLSS